MSAYVIPLFNLTGAVGYSFSHFGGGSGGIFLDNLGCYGYESRLLDCIRPTIGVHDCDHSDDAGVRCQGREAVHATVAFPTLATSFILSSKLRVNISYSRGTALYCDSNTTLSHPTVNPAIHPANHPTDIPSSYPANQTSYNCEAYSNQGSYKHTYPN